ncbi:MAG: hypothetical protein JXP34_07520 [Planctomycetes bacterium]|nr:hypothetical protein [Planctomycetota bacterium]
MPIRLSREEVMAIKVLGQRGVAKRGIARTLGVAEGTIRYRLRRAAEGSTYRIEYVWDALGRLSSVRSLQWPGGEENIGNELEADYPDSG